MDGDEQTEHRTTQLSNQLKRAAAKRRARVYYIAHTSAITMPRTMDRPSRRGSAARPPPTTASPIVLLLVVVLPTCLLGNGGMSAALSVPPRLAASTAPPMSSSVRLRSATDRVVDTDAALADEARRIASPAYNAALAEALAQGVRAYGLAITTAKTR